MPKPTTEPAYVRIAADLRARIRRGALRPGQRVPSTRRLAVTWKVALATAVKALGLLAREGLVVAVPRVGNLVVGPPARETRKSAGAGSLDRESIVLASIAMADLEGLGALSMRGVAAKMGAPVTSLYRHVSNKDELLRLMVDAVMDQEPPAPSPRGTWRARLETGARMEWRLVRRHPWVARVTTLTRPIPSPISLRHAEWMLSALATAGLDPETMMRMHVTIYAYVQGLASNVEAEAQAEGDTGLDEAAWMLTREPEFAALAANGQFPTFARVMAEISGGFDLDLDSIFEFGLALLLDGLAKRLGEVKTVPVLRAGQRPSHPRGATRMP